MTAGSTVVKRCSKNCKNEFQDKEYGVGMRVHTIHTAKKNMDPTCTVCSPDRKKTRMIAFANDWKPIHG
jgi:hypothetical protein